MKNYKLATFFVTFYLIVYTILHEMEAPLSLLGGMFAFSPFLVIWMVYTILRYATYAGPDLDENQEWGYQDKDRNSLS